MDEYVKWCSSVLDAAEGSLSSVILRTRRYSEKNLSTISCFFEVNSNALRTIHFLKVLPKSVLVNIGYIFNGDEERVRFLLKLPQAGFLYPCTPYYEP